MVSTAKGGGRQRAPAARISGRRRAAGIYGAIVTAAIIAANGGELTTVALVVAVVVVTLLVYWVAEEYAEVIGGLAVAVVLLTIHGWSASRAARLSGWQLLLSTSVAAGLGIVMIVLKDVVLIHLH
jgi:predicted membrane protein